MILLTACSSPDEARPAPTAAGATTSIVVPTGVATAPPGAEIQNDDGSMQTPSTAQALALDDDAREKAVQKATKAMVLFARRNVPADQWWTDLVPLMTPQAQQAYRYTDPRNVPATAVTGRATVTPASKPQVARVSVPTDAGVYLVILARDPEQPAWLVDRILPPESLGER